MFGNVSIYGMDNAIKTALDFAKKVLQERFMTPKISIITPMYCCSSFISETIDSVRKQSEKNWEMIIVDDCSPDHGAGCNIVNKYEKIDNRIRLIRLENNKGSSGARNEAMRNAQGKYYAFLDADDVWDSNYLEIMLGHIDCNKNEKAALIFCGYRRMNDICSKELMPPYSKAGLKNYKALLYHCPIFPSAVILDTSKLKDKIYFREELKNLRDDYVFWLDILRQDLVAIGYDNILVNYRMRENSLTSVKLNMIKPQWNVYRKILKIDIFKSFIYLASWAVNGIIKYNSILVINSLIRKG
jgi:glycosyltransferase involved in cell wall biosynthesis